MQYNYKYISNFIKYFRISYFNIFFNSYFVDSRAPLDCGGKNCDNLSWISGKPMAKLNSCICHGFVTAIYHKNLIHTKAELILHIYIYTQPNIPPPHPPPVIDNFSD